MSGHTYDLSCIEDKNMKDIFEYGDDSDNVLETLKLKQHLWRYNGSTYYIIKYDKNYLTFDRVQSTGLLRSVIHKKSKILSFSPPKSLECSHFQKTYAAEECYAEEFVEGTMINVFYDSDIGEWEIATRSCVGADNTYFTSGKVKEEDTFRYMFTVACKNANFDLSSLSKDYCYSFVLQHPHNRIVIPFTETSVYLIAAYKIDGYTVTQMPREMFRATLPETIRFPEQYELENYSRLRDKWASQNTDYKHMGVVIVHKESLSRTKFRNPSYEFVRQLRGNQPKLQYTYIALRQSGKVKEYIGYYPEVKGEFNLFRQQIHQFTEQLHKNYITCYINKVKPLREYPFQFRSHMITLHAMYLDVLREKKEYINKTFVVKYINELHPSKLMFSLNYCMRQHHRDEITSAET
jgi:hypothetical protein